MIKFTYIEPIQSGTGKAPLSVEITTHAIHLSEVVEQFEAFVRAVGFNPIGHLDFFVEGEQDE